MQHTLEIRPQAYYSNGAYGRSWGVRLVVTLARDEEGVERVRYRGVAGRCRRKAGDCSLAEFRAWARHEVCLNENSWLRVSPGGEAEFPPPGAAAG
ncbi:MAG TPA: hypothetical protein PKH69_07880 [Thiobacillaceae bacterium]|nr:hypothetical protein [Thiobacillaceae bacterium]HNU63981.1 hypothetical protein [Thiobacillaceae bacterium]